MREDKPDPSRSVAIVGLGGVFPQANNVPEFWRNVVGKRDCISEVPRDRWDPDIYFDPDLAAEDKTFSKIGGFVADIPFDSKAFRIPPTSAQVMDRIHKMALVAAAEAFQDFGHPRKAFDRSRTAVILGVGGGRLEIEVDVSYRVQFPLWEDALRRKLEQSGMRGPDADKVLSEFRERQLDGIHKITEDSFAGMIPNGTAGRIANCFDLGGPNFVVDAACGSSLAAVDCAVEGLLAGDFDLALSGGGQANMSSGFFVMFSKFHGFSRTAVRPFDAHADGFLLGEGFGAFLLKRLADAQRDGDRVYAVVRGVGASSDGRGKAIGAPDARGQSLAMQRAMEAAGYSPGTVQFIETHGTGTPVGDPVEIESMRTVFGPHVPAGERIALSAVKSQIGHLMGGAGAAGLMKTVLALHHRQLPPTINHHAPSPAIPWTEVPFRVVTEVEPWPENRNGLPRRANVSSFGFGGNNHHLALEAYREDYHGELRRTPPAIRPAREAVAIVGIGALVAGAGSVQQFWQSVLEGTRFAREVPPEKWEGKPDLFYEENPEVVDKTHGRLGHFSIQPELNSSRLGIPPLTLAHMDPAQRQVLATSAAAVEDAGGFERLNPARTALMFGEAAGCRHTIWHNSLRLGGLRAAHMVRTSVAARSLGLAETACMDLAAAVRRDVLAGRAPISEDTAVACATSIGAAWVTKSFGFMGQHLALDAACGSSAAAICHAVRSLQMGKWDAVLAGGVSAEIKPDTVVVASKARALSADGSRPFDRSANGYVPGEGAVIFVLKRLSDAEAAGDRIYAVIRGVGSSSNGKGLAMYAPGMDAQALSIVRAWSNAGVSPESIQFIDCHATATAVGDAVEAEAIRRALGLAKGGPPVGISASKAQFGHTLAAAGSVGLARVALGLHHKVLPPMPPVSNVIDELHRDRSPLRLITRPEPWPVNAFGEPRRAGVNSFGFGGTNWHLVVEEYPAPGPLPEPLRLIFAGANFDGMMSCVRGAMNNPAINSQGHGPARLVVTADTPGDCRSKLQAAERLLRPGQRSLGLESQGIYYGEGGRPQGKVAFLFPGQGGQYADMLRDLADHHAVVRDTLAEADQLFAELAGVGLRSRIFTVTRTTAEREEVECELAVRSDLTQPALLTFQVALCRLLASAGLAPDAVAGHSLGEYGALVAAGVLDFRQALSAVYVRGLETRRLAESGGDPGRMGMAAASSSVVAEVIAGVPGYVTISNLNCRTQTVFSGETRAVEAVAAKLEHAGTECRVLPIAGAFHSRIARAIRQPMAEALAGLAFGVPRFPVYSTVEGEYLAGETCGKRVLQNLLDQLERPVDFIGLVDRMTRDGVSTFVEVGPKNALTGFVDEILAGRPHTAIFANHPKIGEVSQWNRALGQIHAMGFFEPPVASSAGSADAASSSPPPQQPRPTPPPAARPHRQGDSPSIVISGVAVGLPGKHRPVFSDDNWDQLFSGKSLIDPIPVELQDRMVAKGITRVVKPAQGEAWIEPVRDRQGTVKIAGQRGQFDLRADYGISEESLIGVEPSYQLAMAAGIEGLRDAGIPLVQSYKVTSTGTSIPAGWVLPESLQEDTAVLFACAYPGHATLMREVAKFTAGEASQSTRDAVRSEYLSRLEKAATAAERANCDAWFAGQLSKSTTDPDGQEYRLSRSFLTDVHCMGNNRFAQLIRARGPNFQLNAACSSTSIALMVAEDMITCGRARRVVILGADDVTSSPLLEWTAAGFLAAGAAATDAESSQAAVPFDRRRHGMVIGMGAVCLVVESADAARERGWTPLAELLGTHCSNSATHFTRPDPQHVASELDRFITRMEQRQGLNRHELAGRLLYMSHETFTPARGGIAETEVHALRETFGDDWRNIVVANTKAMTGHTQGAGIEEAVALKAMQFSKVPPVLNHREPDPALAGIRLSPGGACNAEFALRFSAGFGSQVAMSLMRAVCRGEVRIEDQTKFRDWLTAVTGLANPELEVVHRTLRVKLASPSAPEPARAVTVIQPTGAQYAEIEETVLSLISQKTGYERELLELDLDLEAELGIDTIKQAEVIGLLRDKYNVPRDKNIKIKDFPTLRHVIQYIADRTGAEPATPPAAPSIPVEVQMAAPPPEPALAAAVTQPTGSMYGEIEETVLNLVSQKTGYERELLELDLDLEADLGIDTIKQAEVIGLLRDKYNVPRDTNVKIKDFPTLLHVIQYIAERSGAKPAVPPPAPSIPEEVQAAPVPEPVPAAAVTQPIGGMYGEIEETVLNLVSQKTGYERELLELDLDLEADLGIDTIKQAEVIGLVRDKYNVPRDTNVKIKDFPTLRHVIQYIADRTEAKPTAEAPPLPVAITAPAPEPAPLPAPPATTVTQPTGGRYAEIEETVLNLVSQKTGYERELLELDLDLEAELGIDTIKQAEVIAQVRDKYNVPRETNVKIKDFPTLRHVIQYIAERTGAGVPAPQPLVAASPALPVRGESGVVAPGIRRMVLTSTECPFPSGDPSFEVGRDWTVLITDDGRGVATALKKRIEGKGAQAIIIPGGVATTEEARLVVNEARGRLGSIRGLIHLAPLSRQRAVEELDPETFRTVVGRNVLSPFLLAKELREDLVLAVVATISGDPCGAGASGLFKSLAQEMPEWRVKAIDLPVESLSNPDTAAGLMIREIESGGRRVELSYSSGKRCAPSLVWQPLAVRGEPRLTLGQSSLVVLFGGARGVTAEIGKDLAKHFRPGIVLVGSTILPENSADWAALDAAGIKRFKQDLATGLQARGERLTPVAIEREFAPFGRAIEIQRTLEALHQFGARARYLTCDVRNYGQVKELFDTISKSRGKVDGIVFGAGTIEDRLLESKTLESFDRVFGVKAEGLHNVAQAAGWDGLKFFLTFSSVAGRFGNRGQTDYAAGNEVVNKLTVRLAQLHPATRCAAIGWTAWARVGLAHQAGVTEWMRGRGFDVLEPEDGATLFRRELQYGSDDPEVLITGDVGELDRDGALNATPLIGGLEAYRAQEELTAIRTLDLATDSWLLDHVIDGTPLLPGVMGIEMMAEAARLLFPGSHFAGIDDLRINLAVKMLKGRPVKLCIRARAVDRTRKEDAAQRVKVVIESDFVRADGKALAEGRCHYEGTVVLSGRASEPEMGNGGGAEFEGPLAFASNWIYGAGSALPHGPRFQVLDGLQSLEGSNAVGVISGQGEASLFSNLNGHHLESLPLAREAGFQVAGLWELVNHGSLGLPHGCRRLRRLGFPPPGVRLAARAVMRGRRAQSSEYDIEIVGDDGRIYDRMEGYYNVRIDG